jgi:hypothetical protein
MVWIVALPGVTIGLAVFMWAYGRRLEVLSGAWIAKENLQND